MCAACKIIWVVLAVIAAIAVSVVMIVYWSTIANHHAYVIALTAAVFNLLALGGMFYLCGENSEEVEGLPTIASSWGARLKRFVATYDVFLVGLVGLWLITLAAVVGRGAAEGSTEEGLTFFLRTVGVAVVASGIGGYLTRSQTTLGFFREAVADIAFGNRYLSTRSDIRDIWKRASKAIAERKFPAIADGVLDELIALYMDLPHPYYRDKYVHFEVIEWADEKKQKLKVRTTVIHDVVPASTFDTVEVSNRMTLPRDRHELGDDKLEEFSVDGEDCKKAWKDPGALSDAEWIADKQVTLFEKKLTGKSRYAIKRVRERMFDPRVDPLQLYVGSHPINQMRVDIENRADGLKVRFVPVGTGQAWCDTRVGTARRGACTVGPDGLSLTYSGVTFPHQGFGVQYVAS